MNKDQPVMRPLDVVVLLKIVLRQGEPWLQEELAKELAISQSELSKSIARSRFSRLIDGERNVGRLSLMQFIEYGIAFVIPASPGPIVRGMPTSHSAKPLSEQIKSDEQYVWASSKGRKRGQSIIPLFKTVPQASANDPELYELLALVDAIRVGRAREKNLAIAELKRRLVNE